MSMDFAHKQFAHCETGVTAGLMTYRGVHLTEAFIFGTGSGLFFIHFPYLKFMDLPLTAFRTFEGRIFKKATNRLGIGAKVQTFRNPDRGMEELDRLLDNGIPVGLQAGIFWLPYFWPAFRMHINLHNLVVYGKENGDYFISDPAMSVPVTCPAKDLKMARFAKGILAPHGKMYYLTSLPDDLDRAAASTKAIRDVCHIMLRAPLPYIGVRGIRYLAGQMEAWPAKLGDRKALLYLAQVIRMQEEIGTGGAGFRFMYAAFLQEAAAILHEDRLLEISSRLTEVGDQWRVFAAQGARHCKGRSQDAESFPAMAGILRDCSRQEEAIFRDLSVLMAKRH